MSRLPVVSEHAISIDREQFRALMVQLLLAPTTPEIVTKSLQQYFPQVGLELVTTHFVTYQDGKLIVASRGLVVDAQTKEPINPAIKLLAISPEEVAATLRCPADKFIYLGATYFLQRKSAEAVALGLLSLPNEVARG